ncbi:MAG: arylformamidase [Armatimonadaceae bacterium]
MTIYDISMPVQAGTPVWEGDTPYRFNLTWQMSKGSSVNVGAVAMSTHTGTHVDAPLHFLPNAGTIGSLPLPPFLGPAVVADVRGKSVISIADLADYDFQATPRLLLRSDFWEDRSRFPEAIPTLAPEVPSWLSAQGVCLVGVDVPSVDPLDSKELPVHHALAAGNIAILESLDLRHISPGNYTLIALPLSLTEADASPVRAVLMEGSL